ncbi:MAG TPA: hypothetical protein VLI05_00515 [Candidatus Saccharimonadia bacterium]|nr:hypothetical protein [Candidatus Saccharimonadia bacterium]
MKTVPFTKLPAHDKEFLEEAVKRLPHSLNKVTNPSTSAIANAENGHYFGNNIFLSNDTLACAEANALASAAAAGDRQVSTLYLVITRTDSEPAIVSPCGNCRQWLHDFARLNNRTIELISATSRLDNVMLTNSDELLPDGFKSAGLGRMAGEV